jgi:hypothetical protein
VVSNNDGNRGEFTMEDGTISGNTSQTSSGGVLVADYGTFTMNGGTISGNTAIEGGGGVCVGDNGTFTMIDGKISANNAKYGGGVAVHDNLFNMNGGEIFGNTATTHGGGVLVGTKATFTMNGGKIYSNTAQNGDGGGVLVDTPTSTFTMEGGSIYNNTANGHGGGVRVWNGIFNKPAKPSDGGTINNNNAAYGKAASADSEFIINFYKKRNADVPSDVRLYYNGNDGTAYDGWEE